MNRGRHGSTATGSGENPESAIMAKTATQLFNFLQNGESNLRNMTDEKGNPIGDQIMKSLEVPLKFAQNFQPGQSPNLAQYQSMMATVNDTVAKIKEQNSSSQR